MIILPGEVQEALTNKSRYITAKVYLEINNEMVNITDTLINFSIDESISEGSLPYGQITYNQLSITLDNIDKRYMLNNTESPYYGELVSLKRLRIEYLIEYEKDKFYSLTLADYYVDAWKATTDSSTATVTAYDSLYSYGNRALKKTRVYKDISIKQAFKELFNQNDINYKQYKIDESLSLIMDYWWAEGSTLADALQSLCEIGGANVFCNKQGVIEVTQIGRKSNPVLEINDSNIVLDTKAEPSYKEQYAYVDVKYNELVGTKTGNIYTSNDEFIVEANRIKTIEVACKESPIINVYGVSVLEAKYIDVIDFNCTNNTLTVTLQNNSNKDVPCHLQIFGQYLDLISKEFMSYDPNSMKLDTVYVISEQFIRNLTGNITSLYSSTISSLTLDIRMLPNLELYDKVTYKSQYSKINGDFYITKIEHDYSSGLLGSITLSAALEKEIRARYFISPGLSIQQKEGN